MIKFKDVKSYPSYTTILLFITFSFLSVSIQAQKTALRISSQSTSWHEPKMWDCKCVPSAEHDVIIAGHQVVINEDAQAKSVSITNGEQDGGLIVNGASTLSISNNLNLQTNPKTAKAATINAQESAVINVGGDVNLSRPES